MSARDRSRNICPCDLASCPARVLSGIAVPKSAWDEVSDRLDAIRALCDEADARHESVYGVPRQASVWTETIRAALASPTPTGPEPAKCARPGRCACEPLRPGDEHCRWFPATPEPTEETP